MEEEGGGEWLQWCPHCCIGKDGAASCPAASLRGGLGGRRIGRDEIGLTIPEVFDGDECVDTNGGTNQGVHLMHVATQPEKPTWSSRDDQNTPDHSCIRSFTNNER